jgi:hypothetical protein
MEPGVRDAPRSWLSIETKLYIEARAELRVENESVVRAFMRGSDKSDVSPSGEQGRGILLRCELRMTLSRERESQRTPPYLVRVR